MLQSADMPFPERRLPEWAARERAGDLAWIGENMHIFWPGAQQGFAEHGRGAIITDTTVRAGTGNPIFYMPEAGIAEMKDPDALRMVRGYDPSWELVAMLLKGGRRVSTYRVGVPSARHP